MKKQKGNSNVSKVNSFYLLDEIILFEDKMSILTESFRHSVIDSKKFNFSQYNYELRSLLDIHEERLHQLKLHKADDVFSETRQISRIREN